MWDFITSREFISSVGLGLDIFGAFLIWKFGLQMSPNEDGSWKFEESKNRTKWGLGFLGVGFLLQGISNWF